MTITDLDVLIGSWTLSGRTIQADHDDITGELTVIPILNGRMLQLTGSMRMNDSQIESLELIWYDDNQPGFAAHVYSDTGAPLDYRWDRDGNTLLHAGLGMTYTGTISADGATITGTWLPDSDRPDMSNATYDSTMRRIN